MAWEPQVYPPPQDLQQSLQARLSAELAQQGSGGFGEPPDSAGGGARSGGGDSGGPSGNDELTEVRCVGWRHRCSYSACSRQPHDGALSAAICDGALRAAATSQLLTQQLSVEAQRQSACCPIASQARRPTPGRTCSA